MQTPSKKLGFGLMRLPTKDEVIDHEELCRMMDAYMQAGLNYFDTADLSGDLSGDLTVGETIKIGSAPIPEGPYDMYFVARDFHGKAYPSANITYELTGVEVHSIE